ncbi:MAG: hypothetical protein H6625_06200 [Bdellovibrionaceae bacterium]|nr:hypothetical protein [Pseudobdellovibrionaceae bacterium]
MFWGAIFTAIGISMIINHVFKIDLPIFQICIGVFLIYLGVKWIFGSFDMDIKPRITNSAAIFGKGDFSFPTGEQEKDKNKAKYEVVFGSGTIDLRGIDLSKEDVNIKIETVFGESILLIDKNTPFTIKSETVFGQTSLPMENKSFMGTQSYRSENFNDSTNHLIIKANVVFGSLKIMDSLPDKSTAEKPAF